MATMKRGEQRYCNVVDQRGMRTEAVRVVMTARDFEMCDIDGRVEMVSTFIAEGYTFTPLAPMTSDVVEAWNRLVDNMGDDDRFHNADSIALINKAFGL